MERERRERERAHTLSECVSLSIVVDLQGVNWNSLIMLFWQLVMAS